MCSICTCGNSVVILKKRKIIINFDISCKLTKFGPNKCMQQIRTKGIQEKAELVEKIIDL